jgi:DNA-binding NarL/FixJ family response regulator
MARGERIRVLVCDDVEGWRALLRFTLAEDPDIEVVGEAADGEEGVRAAEDLQPDVVLLDMQMPRMDGLSAIPRMRRRAPRTTIIGLSSHSAERMRGPSIAVGAHDYVEKTADLEDIRAAIRQAVDNRRE